MACALQASLGVERLDRDALGRTPDDNIGRRVSLLRCKSRPVFSSITHVFHLKVNRSARGRARPKSVASMWRPL